MTVTKLQAVDPERFGKRGRVWGDDVGISLGGGNKIYFIGGLGAGVDTGSVGGGGVISECCCPIARILNFCASAIFCFPGPLGTY